MNPSRFQKLVRLSRDRGALIRASLVLAGVALVLALVLSTVFASRESFQFESGVSPSWTNLPDPSDGYLGMARDLLRLEGSLLASRFVVPALFTAAIWAAILLSFRPPAPRFLLAGGIALILGVLASILASYAALIQEGMRGFRFREEDPPAQQLLYFLAGVSLR